MADEKKVENKQREKSFPPSYLDDRTGQINVLRQRWKQSKLELCSEEKCYYPLRKFAHDQNGHEAKIVSNAKGKFHEGVCSWDPLHGTGELVAHPGTADGKARVQLIPIPDPKQEE